jgi:hypothetical protein
MKNLTKFQKNALTLTALVGGSFVVYKIVDFIKDFQAAQNDKRFIDKSDINSTAVNSRCQFVGTGFDYNALQAAYPDREFTYNAETGLACETQKWKPDIIAKKLKSEMSGWNAGSQDRLNAWKEVSQLGVDRARLLHNFWLKKVDPGGKTLYTWIEQERPQMLSSWYSKEKEAQSNALKNLAGWIPSTKLK